MKLLRFHSALALTFASAFTLAACGSEDEPDGGTTPTDVGFPDSGVNPSDTGVGMDATPGDTGPRDTGPGDSGPTDTGIIVDPCTDGEEGCECTSSITALPFLQDDCQAGLLCIPWDALSQRTDLTDAFQTCVKPCTTDTECGTGRICTDAFGFGATSGAERICADAPGGIDEFCGGSRQTVSVVPQVNKETTQITGCPTGSQCLIGTFSDIHVDEGICLSFCQDDTECAAPTPYCNPRLFTSTATATPFIGVCSERAIGAGSFCGSQDPDKLGLTSRCDTSEAACGPNQASCPVCIGLPAGFAPDGLGVCTPRCSATVPCRDNENGLPQNCIEGFLGSQPDGVCSVGCTNFPENCSGPGVNNLGRTCVTGLAIGQDPFNFCTDRYGPALVAATVDSAGQLVSEGDDCLADPNNFSNFRCPQGALCLDDGNGAGLCLYGCGRVNPADATICDTVLTQTATCAPIFQDQTVGVCGDG